MTVVEEILVEVEVVIVVVVEVVLVVTVLFGEGSISHVSDACACDVEQYEYHKRTYVVAGGYIVEVAVEVLVIVRFGENVEVEVTV